MTGYLKGGTGMPRELAFYNPYFEEAVRNALNLHDRPVYDTDTEKLEELDCESRFDERDCHTLAAFCNLKRG